MANYTTKLKTFGDIGTAYPTGYSYTAGEQPVDEWDDFLAYNTIEDIKALIATTNSRIETDKGPAGGEPTTPETSHIYHDEDNNDLKYWDSVSTRWHRLLRADGDTLTGNIDVNSNRILGADKVESENGGGTSWLNGKFAEIRSKGGTAANLTFHRKGSKTDDTIATLENDSLMHLGSGGWDGSGWSGAGRLEVLQDGVAATDSIPGRLEVKLTQPGNKFPTKAFSITSDHNVDINRGSLTVHAMTEPPAPDLGWRIYHDKADDDLKAKHNNGTVTTLAMN